MWPSPPVRYHTDVIRSLSAFELNCSGEPSSNWIIAWWRRTERSDGDENPYNPRKVLTSESLHNPQRLGRLVFQWTPPHFFRLWPRVGGNKSLRTAASTTVKHGALWRQLVDLWVAVVYSVAKDKMVHWRINSNSCCRRALCRALTENGKTIRMQQPKHQRRLWWFRGPILQEQRILLALGLHTAR